MNLTDPTQNNFLFQLKLFSELDTNCFSHPAINFLGYWPTDQKVSKQT